MAKTRAKRGTLPRVLRYVRRYWFLLLLSMVLAAATVALTLYLPILVGDAIDLILAPGKVDFAGILPILWTAAALAGLLASSADPAVPINGAALQGLGGVAVQYSDNDVDLLVRGGVTPLEAVGGVVSPIRGITTRTKTGGTADSTWRELTTILIVDDVIPAVRTALRSKFSRAKNTTQTRGAIRSQVIVELERKVAQEIIDSYGDVTAEVDTADPTVCVVEFSFSVSHGLNQIYLTAHITV